MEGPKSGVSLYHFSKLYGLPIFVYKPVFMALSVKQTRMILYLMALVWVACAPARPTVQTQTDPLDSLLRTPVLQRAHVGVLVVDAASSDTLFAHQPHHYFVPASNTKLWSMYAGMKYLGDQLTGGWISPVNDSVVYFKSNGDPTFLHRDFATQPLRDKLQQYKTVKWVNPLESRFYGSGWAWGDYEATYSAPRSNLPLYGNEVEFRIENGRLVSEPAAIARFFTTQNPGVRYDSGFSITRAFDSPLFFADSGRRKTVATTLYPTPRFAATLAGMALGNHWEISKEPEVPNWQPVYTIATDSMLKPMMHRSDNFFAEQTLLMAGQKINNELVDRTAIAKILETDLAGMPDNPRWADGSGLSRYNMFSPADYVWLLRKMSAEFPQERINNILPTGGKGTLSSLYHDLQGKIFAKTGTLNNVVALSGYLTTRQNKQLLFSLLVNNHNGTANEVRKAFEQFLTEIHARY